MPDDRVGPVQQAIPRSVHRPGRSKNEIKRNKEMGQSLRQHRPTKGQADALSERLPKAKLA